MEVAREEASAFSRERSLRASVQIDVVANAAFERPCTTPAMPWGATMKRICRIRRTGHAIGTACASVLAAAAQPAWAEEVVEPRGGIRIEVTGTNIPRSESETALPVQNITRDDIQRSGSASVAELMSKVSANVGGFNDQLSIGNQIQSFPRPGLSSRSGHA